MKLIKSKQNYLSHSFQLFSLILFLKVKNMLKSLLFIGFLIVSIGMNAQTRSTEGWIDYGGDHNNKYYMIAPAKMGPNAIPVPRMDYGLLPETSSFEIGADAHFMAGDQAVNSYLNLKWNVAPGKVLIEIWGFPSETFRISNELRDERQIYNDDTGWITHQGDLWISTHIQLLKDHKKLPDIILSYNHSSTTGMSYHARYTDGPIQYFYLAFGKSYYPKNFFFDEIRLGGMYGWYIWQTNKVKAAQDEGSMEGLGLMFKKKNLFLYQEISGFHGYDAYGSIGQHGYNDPIICRSRLEYKWKKKMVKVEYQTGLRDYLYQTFRLSGTVFF